MSVPKKENGYIDWDKFLDVYQNTGIMPVHDATPSRGYQLESVRLGILCFHEDGSSHVEWYSDTDRRLLLFF